MPPPVSSSPYRTRGSDRNREGEAMSKRVLIMGAAGRDFHNFNVVYRDDPDTEVVAFTATQIPFIENRKYPAELAGPQYPDAIQVHGEKDLTQLIHDPKVTGVVFA